MPAKRKKKCAACCKSGSKCKSCKHCLPRYLCVHVVITDVGSGTGTGSGSGSGSGTSKAIIPCCGRLDMRLFSASDCGWEGSEDSCSIGSIRVDIVSPQSGTGSGTLVGTGTNNDCATQVTGSLIEGKLLFSGVLKDINFTVTKNGLKYDFIIGAAAMVPNPLAVGKCAPCSCVTCLPSSLCVTVSDGSANYYSSQDWDCHTNSWKANETTGTGATGTGSGTGGNPYTVSLHLATDVCGIRGNISGPGGVDTAFLILLEGTTQGSDDIRGAICLEGNGALTIGSPNYKTQSCYTVLHEVITFQGDTGTGTVVGGTVVISDKSCNQLCRACRCCSVMPDTFYVTVDTPCVWGVVQFTFQPATEFGTELWRVTGGSLTHQDCSLEDPPVIVTQTNPMPTGNDAGVANCIDQEGGLHIGWVLADASFSFDVLSCQGGTVQWDDPTVQVWGKGGTCCVRFGPVPNTGSVTVSP